jgi:class 3 adenylate cyclase
VTATAGTLTGALTFLFTDLEGSTRTWEHDAAAMDRWLAAHDAILMRAIEAGGGRVFKHTGDGICAVFRAAAAAAAVAVDIQEKLAAGGAAVGPLRVRVVLHTGEAFARGGDYYGPTLNRCARLLEIAHGGQVLLSAPVAALLAGGAVAGKEARLGDLGLHRLRDLQQPERVWQLSTAGRPDEFPPLRSRRPSARDLRTDTEEALADFLIDTRVDPTGEKAASHRSTLSPHWAVWGPNGGYVAAIALRAAMAQSRLPRPGGGSADEAPGEHGDARRLRQLRASPRRMRRARRDDSARPPGGDRTGRSAQALDECLQAAPEPAPELGRIEVAKSGRGGDAERRGVGRAGDARVRQAAPVVDHHVEVELS